MSARFGLFHLDGNHLALPIEALREAVPTTPLALLPGCPPYVLGSMDLRGQRLPVADLRLLAGGTSGGPLPACVVVVQHQDKLLGVLADDVEGVQEAEPQRMSGDNGGILDGSLPAGASGISATLLNPAALLGYPGIPSASVAADSTPDQSDDSSVEPDHVMLMQCGSVPLAMACSHIHTIILNPHITQNAMSSGYCMGTIQYAGQQIAAVSLLAACSIPLNHKPALTQAFVIRYAQGYVAFMVEHIIDVVQRTGHTLLPLPPQSLLRPDHFLGAIPASETPADSVGHHASPSGHYLLLDGDMLTNRPDLACLAGMNTPHDTQAGNGSPAQPGSTPRQQGERCQLLTYDLGFEVATPVSQIIDIVPWQAERAVFGLECEHAGLLIARGRTLPLYCLSSTLGIPLAPIRDTASVLVVETDYGVVGFAVPGLITIDEAWQERLDNAEVAGPPAHIRHSNLAASWRHVLVGQGKQERLLSLLDLVALAESKLAPQAEPVDLT